MPASPCAWPARACSSRAKRRSSISCWAAIARFWCAPPAWWKRCAIASRATHGRFQPQRGQRSHRREFFALGLQYLTPTHDLNAAQVAELARQVGGERIEAVAYQHLPVFHTEHCVFCRFLSTGTSYRDCGRPCEEHRVALRDTAGRAHPVMADVGCRNTVFGAEAQEASLHLEAWRAAGIARFRLEFAHESAAR
jgi:hypothetical protein